MPSYLWNGAHYVNLEDGSTVSGKTPAPRLGVYDGSEIDAHEKTLANFGAYPELTCVYMRADEPTWMERERGRMELGISPVIAYSTSELNWLTNRIAALAQGPSHPEWQEASDWMDARIAECVTLVNEYPDVPLYATLDHEWIVKEGRGFFPGDNGVPENFALALDEWIRRCKAAEPAIRTLWWCAGFDWGTERRTQPSETPHALSADRYSRGKVGQETVQKVAAAAVQEMTAFACYDPAFTELGLTETGATVQAGDAYVADYFTDFRQALAEADLDFGILFNRSRDWDHQIAGRTDGQTFPLARAAFSASLGGD